MFDIALMRFNPEAPSFLVMLITALLAFFLSSVIAVTYEFTTKSIYRKAHFLQSLALIGVVAATILQAIGESVAIGLGIIGALSIIRFRTSLNDPRNITFMFASLGVGIACGVMGFEIALTGTLVFCTGALILRFSPLSDPNELIGTLKLRVPPDDRFQQLIEHTLSPLCRNFELERLRILHPKPMNAPAAGESGIGAESENEKLLELVYLIRLKTPVSITALEEEMSAISGLEDLRLDFQTQPTKL
jgi:hypothetical protein